MARPATLQDLEPLVIPARLSQHVYEPMAAGPLDLIYDIQHMAPILSDCGATARMYETRDTVYIAVRGSANLTDWTSNLKAVFRAAYWGILAHRGFVHAARGLEELILDACAERIGKRIVLTGHSRGGAVAVLSAAAVSQYLQQQVEVVTFGQPRVALSGSIRRVLIGHVTRVVNGSDAVTRVPRLGYTHHQDKLVYLSNRRGALVNSGAWIRAKDRMLTFHQRGTDHLMADYIKEIQEAIQCAR